MKCGEKFAKLAFLAAVIIGILTYALFTAVEISEATLLFPALIALGGGGLAALLLTAAIGCGCHGVRDAFCGVGIYAALGGGGAVIAALLTAITGPAADVLFRVGAAISLALITLMLGGIIGFIADLMSCSCGCEERCGRNDCGDSGGSYYDGDCGKRR